MRITDQNGINILQKRPKQGQKCQTKIIGEEGYHGDSVFNNGYFETYTQHRNRFEITRWKVDLWLPKD